MTVARFLPVAWALLVAGAAWAWRPAPRRIRALAATANRRATFGALPEAGRRGRARPLTAAVDAVGRALLRKTGRQVTPLGCRRAGLAVTGAAIVLPLTPMAAVPAGLIGWTAPVVVARRAERRYREAVLGELPDVVDLLVLAVGAGYTVRLAVASVGRRSGGPLGAELRRVTAEASLGRRLADALDELPGRAGEAVRPLVAALVASERYGAPLSAGLERLAAEVRADRRRRAEEAARRVPVKLLFPLVACTLPAFGLLTVAPLIASAVRSLRL